MQILALQIRVIFDSIHINTYALLLKSLLMEGEDQFILHSQQHGHWWLSNTMSISNHSDNIFLSECQDLNTGEIKSWWQDMQLIYLST